MLLSCIIHKLPRRNCATVSIMFMLSDINVASLYPCACQYLRHHLTIPVLYEPFSPGIPFGCLVGARVVGSRADRTSIDACAKATGLVPTSVDVRPCCSTRLAPTSVTVCPSQPCETRADLCLRSYTCPWSTRLARPNICRCMPLPAGLRVVYGS